MAGIHRHQIKLTGEVPPEQEPQALGTKVTLLNLFRIREAVEVAKLRGDDARSVVPGIINAALDAYFEALPESERTVIETNARRSIDFEIEAEARRYGTA